jgi:hypothetical protein
MAESKTLLHDKKHEIGPFKEKLGLQVYLTKEIQNRL